MLREGGKDSRVSNERGREASAESRDRKEEQGAARLAAMTCGEGDARHESAQLFFFLPPS